MTKALMVHKDGSATSENFDSMDSAKAYVLDFLKGKSSFAVLEGGGDTAIVLGGDPVTFIPPSDAISRLSAVSAQSVDELSVLKKLLHSDDWPKAVADIQMADENSEVDKDERAEGIVDIILPSMADKTFLDFGCGQGHVASYVSNTAKLSVGYDIVRDPLSRFEWEDEPSKPFLTTDFSIVKSKAPYDVILMYDVLDHASNPKELLEAAGSLLSEGGKIYVRTHPWTSRHGGHAYKSINKAFVQLVFSKEELLSMGLEIYDGQKMFAPLYTYRKWIQEAGLKTSVEPFLDRQEVDPFFRDNPFVRRRILGSFGVEKWTDDLPAWQMSQCFWDFVLEKG